MFFMTLNRVYDHIIAQEGGERLMLHVNGDARRMIAGINQAQAKMKALGDDRTDDEYREAALFFAGVIFGEKQAEELLKFYCGDAGCVIIFCAQYFTRRLAKKIDKAQKRTRV